MYFDKSDFGNYRADLVDKLKLIPVLASQDRRNDIVRDLPQYIQDNIERRANLRDDVDNIVETAGQYEGGIESLFNNIGRREGPSRPYQEAYSFWQELKWKIKLLEILPDNLPSSQLEEWFFAARPPTATISLPESANIRKLIDILWDQRDTQNRRQPIINLVQSIGASDPNLRPALNQWQAGLIGSEIEDFTPELIQAARQTGREKEAAEVALLVSIAQVNPNDNRQVKVQLFRWTAGMGAQEIVELEPAPNQIQDLPNYLFNIVGREFRRQKPDKIELFLPIQLITENLDHWAMTQEGRALLYKSALVIRLWERQIDNVWAGYAYESWLQRWQRLQALDFTLDEQNLAPLKAQDIPADLEAWQYELQDNMERICLVFGFAPAGRRHKHRLIQHTILNTGMPVALWPHDAEDLDDPAGILAQVLADCPAGPFWKHIHGFQKDYQQDTGRRLALMWDDPTRELPGFQSYAPN